MTYPKPLAELLDGAYEMYRRGHPWVADHELSPKSVVRDMYERAMTFTEYVSFYGLSRSEGLVLRYLADAYKALRQTVPEDAKTEELIDLIEWLGELVRQVDSSLIDEWERLRNPTDVLEQHGPRRAAAGGHRQRARVPGAGAQRAVPPGGAGRAAPLGRRSASSTARTAGTPTPGRRRSSPTSTSTTRSASARTPAVRRCCVIEQGRETWTVRQIFDDPDGDHDWGISAEVDLAASRRDRRGGRADHGRRSDLTDLARL